MKPFLGTLTAAALLLSCLHAEESAKKDAAVLKSDDKVIDANNIEVVKPTTRPSNSLNSSITSILPKYQPPPPPAPAKEKEAEEGKLLADGSMEIDDPTAEMSSDPNEPRNKIIRLPKQVVHADRSPIFKERDIHTKKGLADKAVQRYLNKFDSKVLNRFTIPLFGTSNEARAMAMYREDERLQNIQDIQDTAKQLENAGDSSGADYLRKESDRTFMRSGGMDWRMPKD